MIIGFTGKRGCGKDTAAGRLVERHGFSMLDFTKDVLAPMLKGQGKEVTRDNLIELAMDGRKEASNGVWAERLCDVIKGRGKGDFTISGVRFIEEVECFRKEFGDEFILVSILCADRARYERSMKRGTKGEKGMTFKEYMKVEEKPTEKAVLKTISSSDYVIDNNGTHEDLFREVDELVKLIKTKP